jgi:hypothetical protein
MLVASDAHAISSSLAVETINCLLIGFLKHQTFCLTSSGEPALGGLLDVPIRSVI